jgi:hypothetical protein
MNLHIAAALACDENARHKPGDCTCCGCHTDAVDPTISDYGLRVLIDTIDCPAERRALTRILYGRTHGL